MKVWKSVVLWALAGVAGAQAGEAGNETFHVNKLKLNTVFNAKLSQPFRFAPYAGEWLEPARADQIYTAGCSSGKDFEKDPWIETRERFDLAVSVSRYEENGGAYMDFASNTVGGKTLILDKSKRYYAEPFKGSLARAWKGGVGGSPEFCVVIQPSEVSQLTAQPFATPAKEFLVCKRPVYSVVYDPRRECVDEDGEVDESSDRCVEIALKNPCAWYSVYVRNH